MVENELKGRRMEAGLSQRKLADLSGVSFRTIQDWERWGTDRARVGQLKKVAASLGCDVRDLIS